MQRKHKKQAEKRNELKANFEKEKKLPGADVKALVGEYLGLMGHNVVISSMIGRNTDLQDSQDPKNVVDNINEHINTNRY